MGQENATADRMSGALPGAAGSSQVQVVVRPPVVVDTEMRVPDRPPAHAAPTPPLPSPARPGELARSVSTHASNRRFGRIWYVPIAAIHPTPIQLRKRFSADELQPLAHSIRNKGMTQPVLLRCRRGTADAFELIAGYRRWQAAMLAGLSEVPAIVIDRVDDREALELAVIENLQRRDLSVLEEAEAFRIMVEEHGHTHEQVAALTGRSRSHVSNILRLLSLPAEVKEMIDCGRISFGHARALLASDSPTRLALRIAEEQLSVRETERIVSAAERTPSATESAAPEAPTRPPLPVSRPQPAESRQPAGGTVIERIATEPPRAPSELAALRAEIAQELGALGSTAEVGLDAERPEIRIRGLSAQETAAAARIIRDALQLLSTSRAMRRLTGSGRPG